MSEDRLTRTEIDAIKHRSWNPDMGKLLRHIFSVGGFAPEAPTDQEVNEAIARAQGWRKVWKGYDGNRKSTGWINPTPNSGPIIYDYQPVSNLGQALEAAAALWKARGMTDRLPLLCEQTVDDMFTCNGDQRWAARRIALHLFERIQEREAEK